MPFAASCEVNLTQTRQLNVFLSHLIPKPEGFKILIIYSVFKEVAVLTICFFFVKLFLFLFQKILKSFSMKSWWR